jgi:hypothetical protein
MAALKCNNRTSTVQPRTVIMPMKNRVWVVGLAAVLFLGVFGLYVYRRWSEVESSSRDTALAAMPFDASAVLYADLAELRHSPFAAELYAWAPRPPADAEYAQFVRETGFDYERDLHRAAIAVIKLRQDTKLFAIADGRFNQKKIVAYASQSGTREKRGAREIFSVSVAGTPRRISFTFLRKDRIALTDDADLAALLSKAPSGEDAKQWRQRFTRLAGSPVFAVIRQDGTTASAIVSQAPGGLQSPQLSALLDQLQWITVAGKPEGDRLRVVTEGECTADRTVRQLADLLNGVLVLAQAGLNGPRTRRELDPLAREAYLEMLRGADVSRIDRGETKSVRLLFDVTPKFLAAARAAVPAAPSTPTNAQPHKPLL